MAIYKNREVQILDYGHQRTLADRVTVQNAAGALEEVSIGSLRFTKDEVTKLNQHSDLVYKDLPIVSEDDIKAVRVGVAPSYSQDRIERARGEIVNDEAKKMEDKMNEKAKASMTKDEAITAEKRKP